MSEEEADRTVKALIEGNDISCLSYNVKRIFHKCSMNNEKEEDHSDEVEGITPELIISGAVVLSSLPEDILPNTEKFFILFRKLCNECYQYWREEEEDGSADKDEFLDNLSIKKLLNDSSWVFYLSLKYSTLLEKSILQLVTGHPGMLLKDALNDEKLLGHLPTVLIDILKHLFLPAGLNFRNVLWHGFVAPIEVNVEFCMLLLSLYATIQCAVTARVTEKSAQVSSKDSINVNGIEPSFAVTGMFCGFEALTQNFSELDFSSLFSINDGEASPSFVCFLKLSFFVLPKREEIIISAVKDFCQGKHVSCLMKVIPCLEQSIRLLFSLSNNMSKYVMANVDEYYSTLDGFGQRSKHQLLLDPYLFTYDREGGTCEFLRENNILDVLGEGLYSLLVDLFFAETGPNVRARLAHGINIIYDEEFGGDGTARDITRVILALYFSLCGKFFKCVDAETVRPARLRYYSSTEIKYNENKYCRSDVDDLVQQCLDVCSQRQSIYHPHRVLANTLKHVAATKIVDLSSLIHGRNCIRFHRALSTKAFDIKSQKSADDLVYIKVFRRHLCEYLVCELTEKDSRVYNYVLLSAPGNTPSCQNIATVSSTRGSTIRSLMVTKPISASCHDVYQQCDSFLSHIHQALENGRSGNAVSLTNDKMYLLIQGMLKLTGSHVDVHDSSLTDCACRALTIEFPDVNVLTDSLESFLLQYCNVSSKPMSGLPCCLSILQVSIIANILLLFIKVIVTNLTV